MRSKLEVFAPYIYKNNPGKMLLSHSLDVLITLGKLVPPLLIFSVTKNESEELPKPTSYSLLMALLVGLSTTILPRIRDLLIASVRFDVQKKVTVDMVESIYDRELDTLLAAPTGKVAAITSKNYGSIGEAISTFFSGILPVISETLGISTVLAYRYGAIGLGPVLTFSLYLMSAFLGERKSEALKHDNSIFKALGFGALLSSINHYQMAHQYGNTEHELIKLDEELSKLQASYNDLQYASEKNALVLTIISRLGFLASLAYKVFEHKNDLNKLYSKDFFLFLAYLFRFNSIIESLPAKVDQFYTGLVDSKMVVDFMQGKSTIPDPDSPINFSLDSPPHIEFKSVSFSYENKPLFSDVSFSIEPAQKIAIMGPTGSGKSTLLKLIQRFYNFNGQILINGTDIKKVNKKDLRAYLSVVSQETGLIMDTVYNNIQYGCLSASTNDILKAAQFAALDFDTDRFQEVIKQEGSNFSGGEKQRINIARSFLKKGAYVFLLDEPTAALDQQTSKNVVSILDQLNALGTVLMVTHDPNLAVNADFILYLDHGKIIESGTFEELMENQGAFYQQVLTQCQKLGLKVEDIRPVQEEVYDTTEFLDWQQTYRYRYFNSHQTTTSKHVETPMRLTN